MNGQELTAAYRRAYALTDRYMLEKAEKAVRELAAYTGAEYGTQSGQHSQSLIALGEWHQAAGEYPAAETLLAGVVQTRRRLYGSRHRHTAAALHSLGMVQLDRWQIEKAAGSLKQALDIFREQYGSTPHASTALALNDHACALSALGRTDEALGGFEASAAMHEQLFGMDHARTALAYTNAAAIYCRQGYTEEALSVLKHTLPVQRRCSGANHPRTAAVLTETAAVYSRTGRPAEAEACYRQASDGLFRLLGRHHPLYARSLYSFALHHLRCHRHREALALLTRALPVFADAYDEDSPLMQNLMRLTAMLVLREAADEAA